MLTGGGTRRHPKRWLEGGRPERKNMADMAAVQRQRAAAIRARIEAIRAELCGIFGDGAASAKAGKSNRKKARAGGTGNRAPARVQRGED